MENNKLCFDYKDRCYSGCDTLKMLHHTDKIDYPLSNSCKSSSSDVNYLLTVLLDLFSVKFQ